MKERKTNDFSECYTFLRDNWKTRRGSTPVNNRTTGGCCSCLGQERNAQTPTRTIKTTLCETTAPSPRKRRKTRFQWNSGHTSRGSSFLGDFLAILFGVVTGGGDRLPGSGAKLAGNGKVQFARPWTASRAKSSKEEQTRNAGFNKRTLGRAIIN